MSSYSSYTYSSGTNSPTHPTPQKSPADTWLMFKITAHKCKLHFVRGKCMQSDYYLRSGVLWIKMMKH